jgi:hypothetical protein
MNAMTCVLCDQTDHHVKVSLVEWADPIEGQRFSAVARCQDRVACRKRVEAKGEEWEVAA